MSRKRTTYSADFKAKLVLEVLEGEKTINEIASKYEIIPKNLVNWKKQFLEFLLILMENIVFCLYMMVLLVQEGKSLEKLFIYFDFYFD